ncbi:class I SAM-dependent methyltransferase [Staphylococcus schweitzeri]|uniref:class I SAM-dependent methyltransferase n=1 Tax=Staphylococcus schweitzeri TaxID=1654388 RepID=UPI000503734F|nr:class I SAM-dependent methyltransferase [Staphylococcus schweitzeri]CDR27144.1 methyltransferase domain protein [Staphylococcus schweitzeri]
MSHYYDEDPSVSSNEQRIQYQVNQHLIHLITDNGVFSKDRVDYGSDVLIKTFLKAHPPGPSKRIADVGCGYGPIGLMIAKVSPHHTITMLDVNHRALTLVEKNKKLNDVDNVIVKESNALTAVENESLDFVLTNPPIRAGKETVHRIFEQAFDKLDAKGELFVVIQKKQGMPSAKKKMEALFGNVEVLNKDKGYYILRSIKA